LTCIFFLKGYVRVSIHMGLAIVPALMMLIAGLHSGEHRLLRGMAASLAALMLAAPIGQSWHKLHKVSGEYVALWRESQAAGRGIAPAEVSGSCLAPPALPRLRCLTFPEPRLQAIRFVLERVDPSDHLFIGVMRHDKVFATCRATSSPDCVRPRAGLTTIRDFSPPNPSSAR
jgi:hypothetical protein